MANYTWPINPSVTGPVEILIDGVPTNIQVDTVNPADTVAMPVNLVDSGGVIVGFNNDYGASSGAIRTAAQVGNATGAADFNAGVVGAQTLRTALASDQLSTLATQATLADVNAKFGSLGQKTMAGSAPVVIASDQSTLPVSAASLPLPTGAATEATLLAMSGKLPATIGQKAMAASLAVTMASDQSAIPTRAPVNSAGSSPGSTTVSTAATITAPANAVGFILMNLDTSTTNMRYRIGATAGVGSGQQLQPGRDTGYIPCAANISIIAESGTVNYDVQWILSS